MGDTTVKDAWELARALVVAEGYTYAEASDETGIPLSTLQKRAAREDWQSAKRHEMSYRAQIGALKRKALHKVLAAEDIDPQAIYAWKAIEQAYPEHRYGRADDGSRWRRDHLVEFVEALVAHLEGDDPAALAALAPHLEPFVAKLEAQWAAR